MAGSIYTLWFDPGFLLTRTDFLYLQAGEDVLIAIGLRLLFYAITHHKTGSPAEQEHESLAQDDGVWIAGLPPDD